MNDNLPQTIQKGIFNKIKAWFAKKRKNRSINNEEERTCINNDIQIEVKKDFLSTIKKQTNILAETLQEKLKVGELRASDLSEQEYEEVISLYDSQITEMSNKLAEYKEKIENLRKV